MAETFARYQPQRVDQPRGTGRRAYSIENPDAYVDSNPVGFGNILQGCRNHGVEHLVYASSSSVYGSNTNMPFSVHDNVDHPVSLYAATKKANELMAHTYSHLYNIPTTGLRFSPCTALGPADMALFKFTKAILAGEPIPVFNYGKHRRDFTPYRRHRRGSSACSTSRPNRIRTGTATSPDSATSRAPYRLYNIGNNNPSN